MSTSFYKTLARLTSLCTFFVLLIACGSSNDDSNEITTGDPKPAITLPMAIHYPPAITSTREASITVRGSNTSNNVVTSITLNSTDITTPVTVDENGQWLLDVDLEDGANQLVIAYNNADGEAQTALERTIYKQHSLASPSAIIEYDGQFLLIDEDFIVSVDKTTGFRSIFLGPDNSDNPIVLRQPTGMLVDEANNRLLVLDSNLRAVIAIDLDTKARSILVDCDNEFFTSKCDNEIPQTEDGTIILNYYALSSPQSMTLDTNNNRLLIIDRRGKTTLPEEVEAEDGSTEFDYFYEDPITGGGVVTWSTIYGVSLSSEPANDGVVEVVVDSADRLDYKQLNPTDNAVFKADTNSLIVASTITIEYPRVSSLVSYSPRCIYSIDLSSGERSLSWLSVQERDEENNLAYDIAGGDIVEINLKAPETEDDDPLFEARALQEGGQQISGDETISPYTELSTDYDLSFALRNPSSVKLDRTNNRLIIVDEFGFAWQEKDDSDASTTEQANATLTFFAYDLSEREAGDTSSRISILNQATIPNPDLAFQNLTYSGMTLNEAGDSATFKGFKYNTETEVIEFQEVAVNLTDGTTTLISESAEVTARLTSPSYLQLLSDGETLIVGNSIPQFVMRTSLQNLSESELISGPFDSAFQFKQLSGISYDESTSTLYTTDLEYKSILQFAEGDEDRSILDVNPIIEANNDLNFTSPKDVITDEAGENLFVVDSSTNQVIGINLNSGARSVIVENPQSPFTLVGPQEIMDSGLEPIYAPAGISLSPNENELILLDKSRLNFGQNWGHIIPALLSIDTVANEARYFTNQDLDENRNALAIERYGRRRYSISIDGDIILDERNERLLLPARSITPTLVGSENRGIVITVDTNTGEVDYLYLASFDETVYDKLRRPIGGAIDYVNNQLVLVDREQDALYGINLDSGNATIISDAYDVPEDATDALLLLSPTAVAVDRLGEYAYVSDSAYSSLIKIELATGYREILTTDSATESLNKIYQPRGMTLDHVNQTIYVADNLLDAVVVVDPITGQQAYVH